MAVPLISFANSTVMPTESPVASFDIFSQAATAGINAGNASPNTLGAITQGITSGIGAYQNVVANNQAATINQQSIEQNQAKIDFENANREAINEANKLKLENEKLTAQRNVKLLKQREQIKNALMSGDAALARGALSPTYADLYSTDPKFEDQVYRDLYGRGLLKTEEIQSYQNKITNQRKLEVGNDLAQVAAAEFPKVSNKLYTDANFNTVLRDANINKKDMDSYTDFINNSYLVPSGRYAYNPDGTIRPGESGDRDAKANQYDLIYNGKRVNIGYGLPKEFKDSYSNYQTYGDKLGYFSLNTVPEDVVPDSIPEEPKAPSFMQRFMGQGGSEKASTVTPEETANAIDQEVDAKYIRESQTNPALNERLRQKGILNRPGGTVDTYGEDLTPNISRGSITRQDRFGSTLDRMKGSSNTGAVESNPVDQALNASSDPATPGPLASAAGAILDLVSGEAQAQTTRDPQTQGDLRKEDMQAQSQAQTPAPSRIPAKFRKYINDDTVKRVNSQPLLQGKPTILKAIAAVESGGDVNAKSPTGVKGLLQVTKATANQYGLNRDVPEQNVEAAEKYLGTLQGIFTDRNTGEVYLPLMLAAYNGGQGRILRAVEIADSTYWPDVVQGLQYLANTGDISQAKFKEIRDYPDKVLAYYLKFAEESEALA